MSLIFLLPFSTILLKKAKTDCIVSPANSYAIMDGGIDLAMHNLFGESIEEQIRVETQLKGFAGILPVGAAVAIDLEPNPAGFKHLISAPTMITPQSIAYTENAYFATMAAMALAQQEEYPSITFVGMGGLTGQLTPDVFILGLTLFVIENNLVFPSIYEPTSLICKD